MAPDARPTNPKDEDDVRLVTITYDRCWQASRGRYNTWIEGKLSPLARKFYLVVNATERRLMGGMPSLLEELRFGLSETAEAFEHFELHDQARAVRELLAATRQVAEVDIPASRGDADTLAARERAARAITGERLTRLNRMFPMEETDAWRRLAHTIRNHPSEFPTSREPG